MEADDPISRRWGDVFGNGGWEQLPPLRREPATRVVPRVSLTVDTGRDASSKETLRAVAVQRLGQVTVCYSDGLANDASLHGRVVVRLGVDRQGNPVGVDTSGSDVPNEAVLRCVGRVFLLAVFPPADRAVGVTLLVDLSPMSVEPSNGL